MERRFLNNERAVVRMEDRDGGKKKIVGYAALFYDGTPDTEFVLWDDQYGRAVERIMPGAFDGALKRPDDVRALKNHEPSQLLGRTKPGTLRIGANPTGLFYEIDPPDTGVGRDTVAELERGDLDGSSFSFRIPPAGQTWTSKTDESGKLQEIREVTDVDPLFDVGPVVFPAYEKTTAGLRSAGDITEARAARDEWRKSLAATDAERSRDSARMEFAEKAAACA